MAEILQTAFPSAFFHENYCILIKISQKFVPIDLIYNQSALVKLIVGHELGDKQLFESMLTMFYDAMMS